MSTLSLTWLLCSTCIGFKTTARANLHLHVNNMQMAQMALRQLLIRLFTTDLVQHSPSVRQDVPGLILACQVTTKFYLHFCLQAKQRHMKIKDLQSALIQEAQAKHQMSTSEHKRLLRASLSKALTGSSQFVINGKHIFLAG